MKEVFEKIIEKLEEKFKYNSEQAEIWRSGENVDAYMIGRSDDYIDRANCFGEAIRIVKQAAEEYNSGWIPCSERLPEEREAVLLNDFDGFYELGICIVKCGIKGFQAGDWWSSANNYIAWQPLPQPYQPKGE